MRIVLDTNVVMSALLWRGTPYQLLAAIRQQPSVRRFRSAALLEGRCEFIAAPGLTAVKSLGTYFVLENRDSVLYDLRTPSGMS